MLEQTDFLHRVLLVVKVLVDLQELTRVRDAFKLVAIREIQVTWEGIFLVALPRRLLLLFLSAVVVGCDTPLFKALLPRHDQKGRQVAPSVLLCEELLVPDLVSLEKQLDLGQFGHVFDKKIPAEETLLLGNHLHQHAHAAKAACKVTMTCLIVTCGGVMLHHVCCFIVLLILVIVILILFIRVRVVIFHDLLLLL